jgi:hypothetical protein
MSLVPNSTRSLVDQLLDTVEIRSQVEQCVSDLITDIEFSNILHEQVERERERALLQQQLVEYKYAIAEVQAVHTKEQEYNTTIADQLITEMWSFSKTVGSLLGIEKEHEELLIKFDEIVAKLLQAEDEIEEAKQIISRSDYQRREPQSQPSNTKSTSTNTDNLHSNIESINQSQSCADTESLNSTPLAQISSNESPPAPLPNTSDASNGVSATNVKDENYAPEKPVVELIEDEDENSSLTLDQLETKILLHIFLFLDPLDVLNTAQINIAMYSRVDTLFNATDVDTDQQTVKVEVEDKISTVPTQPTTGNSEISSENRSSSTVPNTQSVVPSKSDQTTVAISTQNAATIVPIPPPTSSVVSSQVATSGNASIMDGSSASAMNQATVPTSKVDLKSNVVVDNTNRGVTLSPISNTMSPPPTNTNSPKPATTPPRNVFSVIQPKLHATTSPPRNASDVLTPQHQRTQSSSSMTQPLNAAMASSMAAKLSDTELNAIIMMTERLKQKEYLANQYKLEKDALVAKLDGTESVKQFLIGKVRDMEASLNLAFTNETKVAQQYERDQEVIAFLDDRVQQLEREADQLRLEKKTTNDELELIRKQANEKSTVMESNKKSSH